MHPRIHVFILLWIFVVIFSGSITAEKISTVDVPLAELSLRQFVDRIVASNPGVQAARMALSSARANRDADSQALYNPDFILNAEDSDSQTRTIGISQSFDWSGKRRARTKFADSNLRIAEIEFLALRRAFIADLLQGLAKYQVSLERNELVVERQELMNDLVDRAQSRFEAGDISQVELDLVQLTAMNVRIRSTTVHAEHVRARQTVQELTPQIQKTNWPKLSDEIPDLQKNVDLNALIQQLPEVLRTKLTVQSNDSLVELRRNERKPDPKVTLKGGQEDEDVSIGLNVTIPLFVRNSFRHEVSAAVAVRDESQLIADDVLHRAHVRLASSTERFHILRGAWVDWESISAESLSRPLDQLQRLWEKGELTTTDYVGQLEKTLEVRESALDLNESLWLAWFDWLMASGQIDVWLGIDS